MSTNTKSICPECQFSEAFYELSIGQKATCFCPRCGCEFQWIFDKTKPKNGYSVIKNKAYGACRMQFSKGHARIGAIVEPITTEIIDEFQRIIADGEILEEGSYLTRWDSQNKFGEILIGSTSDISFL